MPAWIKSIATVGQGILVVAGMAAIVILALNHIIDGAAALTGILVISGAGGVIQGATHVATTKAEQDNNSTASGR